ncbi:MAG: putative glycerol-1-phosphate prenyltransferase [Flavobacteriales bacterium]
MNIFKQIQESKRAGEKKLAFLIDPDKIGESEVASLMKSFKDFLPDFIFVGGSLITEGRYNQTVKALREATALPLILFPGSPTQLCAEVDAVLFLSLISGRNPELLIGNHVVAAPRIKELGIESIATGYMLIDGGRPTTASYISNTAPIPNNKPEIAAATAMAGEMLGLKCIYLDAGSGAMQSVPSATIKAVRAAVDLPILVGGGIRSRMQLESAYEAGADLVVIGTALEQNPERIADFQINA